MWEHFCYLFISTLKAKSIATLFCIGVRWQHTSNELLDLKHMGIPYSRGIEAACWPEYATNLCQCFSPIWYMVKHMIGDDDVETSTLKRDILRVDRFASEVLSAVTQFFLCVLQHSNREI